MGILSSPLQHIALALHRELGDYDVDDDQQDSIDLTFAIYSAIPSQTSTHKPQVEAAVSIPYHHRASYPSTHG